MESRFSYSFYEAQLTVFLLLQSISSYLLVHIEFIDTICSHLDVFDKSCPEEDIKQGPPHRQVAT